MQPDERDQLIAQYKDGYRAVAEALLKITPEELDAKPGPGKWSARQIVHHLADSEMTAAVRLRLLVAEDRPVIRGYDQDRFADRLHYDRPHEASLELFRASRAATAELMGGLSETEWLREGTLRPRHVAARVWAARAPARGADQDRAEIAHQIGPATGGPEGPPYNG